MGPPIPWIAPLIGAFLIAMANVGNTNAYQTVWKGIGSLT